MSVVLQLLQAIWNQDFQTLMNPHYLGVLYGLLFLVLLLENGLLPASFLPGDSLLLLTGALIAQNVLNPLLALLMLIAGAGFGCWLSYLQGQWLGNTRTVRHWMEQLPGNAHQRVHLLFLQHGLAALMIARFLAFVRTLMPTVAGLSGMDALRFQFFNWLSAIVWVGTICGAGYLISYTPFFIHHKSLMLLLLTLLPLGLLLLGLLGLLFAVLRRYYYSKR
ncbi:MAG: DedA family protein [Enterobacteriaceae bacterium]